MLQMMQDSAMVTVDRPKSTLDLVCSAILKMPLNTNQLTNQPTT